MTRTIIARATLYLTITHRTEDGVETITIDQVLSGGVGSSSETRVLDWQDREVDDKVFGPVVTKTRRAKVEDLENDFLKEGWPDAVKEDGLIHTSGRSDTAKSGKTWVAEMVRESRSINDICTDTCSRLGDFKRSTARRNTPGMSSLLGLEVNESQLASSTITVSAVISSVVMGKLKYNCYSRGPFVRAQ